MSLSTKEGVRYALLPMT